MYAADMTVNYCHICTAAMWVFFIPGSVFSILKYRWLENSSEWDKALVENNTWYVESWDDAGTDGT